MDKTVLEGWIVSPANDRGETAKDFIVQPRAVHHVAEMQRVGAVKHENLSLS